MNETGHFYIYHGPEEFLRSEAIKLLRESIGDASSASLNITALDGRRLSLAELTTAAAAAPFLGDRRLVIVQGLLIRLEAKPGRATSKADRDLLDGLETLLTALSPTTWLAFEEDRTLGAEHPILRLAARHKQIATVMHFGRLDEMALRRWIGERARRKGGTLGTDAVSALASMAEQDLRLLDQEIEKLVTYAGGRAVTRVDIQRLVHAARSADVFAMVDAIGQRNGRKALEQFQALIAEGEPPGRLLVMITRQFRMLIQAKDLAERRAPPADVMRVLRVPKFVVDKVQAQARLFTLSQLDGIYRRLLEADQSIKTGQSDPLLAVAALIAEVTVRTKCV